MNWADWLIIAIIVVSSLISIKRGFIKEAISLFIWFLAFFIAVAFQERLAILLEASIASVSLRYMVSFGLLFAATIVVGSMVNYLLGELVRMTGLSGTDRLFGMVFGMARGLIVVMALLILIPMAIPAPDEVWWRESLLIPQLLLMEQWCRDTFAVLVNWVTDLMP